MKNKDNLWCSIIFNDRWEGWSQSLVYLSIFQILSALCKAQYNATTYVLDDHYTMWASITKRKVQQYIVARSTGIHKVLNDDNGSRKKFERRSEELCFLSFNTTLEQLNSMRDSNAFHILFFGFHRLELINSFILSHTIIDTHNCKRTKKAIFWTDWIVMIARKCQKLTYFIGRKLTCTRHNV